MIEPLAESILETYGDRQLIDQYDIYQHLLSYWLETMKDDVYMIAEDGWKAVLTKIVRKKGDKKVEGTIKDGKDEFICDLIPKELLIHRYFSKEWEQIEQLEVETESRDSVLEELVEEHAGEDGLLADVTSDSGKVSKGNVTKRVKQLKKANDSEDADELAVLEKYLEIAEAGSKVDKEIKAAETKLEKKLLEKYGELKEDDVKTLVVDDKWMQKLFAETRPCSPPQRPSACRLVVKRCMHRPFSATWTPRSQPRTKAGQKRDKTKLIKQDMMQELLTGKTRLVSPASSGSV